MKYYIEELADHLKAVLKMRQRIKDRVFRCKQLASNYAKVFGELSQIEVSVNDEISALKNAYVEAAGEIETHVRSFNRYNERGQLYFLKSNKSKNFKRPLYHTIWSSTSSTVMQSPI